LSKITAPFESIITIVTTKNAPEKANSEAVSKPPCFFHDFPLKQYFKSKPVEMPKASDAQ
jgi:hypothetical protein